MRQMIRALGPGRSLAHEAPSALVALVLAEAVYKFHSFTLECLAFLATWYAISWIAEHVFPASSKGDVAR
ncbi:MAG: hypothetical protein ACREOC_03350 [Gemmatimonadales bacterium]